MSGLPAGLQPQTRQDQQEWTREDDEAQEEPQIVLILVGLPGSGKSTFAHALVEASASPEWKGRQWTRGSQDDSRSGRRQEVEDFVRASLRAGKNVLVDRVNFDPEQRAHFISIASLTYPRPRVYGLVLAVSEATLRARLSTRTDHPTLKDPQTAIDVLRRMSRQLVLPTLEEGFDRVLILRENEQRGEWPVAVLEDILRRIDTAPPPPVPHRREPYGVSRDYAPRGGYQPRGYPSHRARGMWPPSSQHGYRGGHGGLYATVSSRGAYASPARPPRNWQATPAYLSNASSRPSERSHPPWRDQQQLDSRPHPSQP